MLIGLYLLLNFAVLWLVARSSAARGWPLATMLLLLGFVVGSANNLLEAVVYGVLSLRQAMVAAFPAAVIFIILSPAAVLAAGRWKTGSQAEPAHRATLIQLVVVVAAYEVLYWTAGHLVFPYIAHFYSDKTIPPIYEVAGLQVVRSLIFFGAAYPLLRTGLRGAPLVLGLVYGIIGGIAPLLPDNPYMPADIRFYHGIETSVSNFLFGLVVGYLFMRTRPLRAAHA